VVEARLRAGRCYLQNADFDNGLREMRDLIDYCGVRVMDWRPSSPGSVLLRWRTHRLKADEETQLLYEALQEARAEVRFVEQNSDYYDVPIKVYYQTDPREASAVERFEGILKWYPDSRLADNLRLALLERGRWSIEQMRALCEQYPSGDAAPRMLLLLGGAYSEKRDAASAEAVLRKLVTDFPDSYEAARAGTMLRNLKPAGKP
jgi:TolA-binding protein